MMNAPTNRRTAPWIALAMLVLFGAVPTSAQGQGAVISGRVQSSSGNPLYGANVVIPDLNISVGTNQQGLYTISIPAERVRSQAAVIRVRFVGRRPETQQIVIRPGAQTVNFSMTEDINQLEAVVVTGVASATSQVKVPFAVSRVDSSQMPVVGGNAVQQLQGKIPGANIVAASGRPGAAPSVILRAPTSINASGRGQGPLYIVDGIILNGSTPDLNPNDIENIEIVKGAAAASLYGARAGGGVINITTKSGRTANEGVKFGVRTEYGINEIPKKFFIAQQTPLAFDPSGQFLCANAATGGSPCGRYVDLEMERRRINDVPTPDALSPQSFLHDFGIALNPGRYRMLNMFQANTFGKTYDQVNQATRRDQWSNLNLDMRGKVGNTGFFGSAGYSRQAGAFEALEGYRRATARLNVDQLIGDKINIQASTFYSTQKEDGGVQEGGTGFFRLSRQPAFVNQHTRDSQGRLYVRSNPLNQGSQNDNPMNWLENYDNETVGTRFLGSVQARYAALSWLDFNGDFAYDRGTSYTTWLQDRGFRTTAPNPAAAVGFIQNSSADGRSINTSAGATARPSFFANLENTFTAQVLYDAQKGLSHFGYGENLAVPGLLTLDAASVNRQVGSGTSDIRALSYRTGADFEYLERYILSLSARREGSSLFGANNRWATFPRVAGAWIASAEPWFPAPDAVSLAKFRAAWGKAGQRPNSTAQYEAFSINSNTGALAPALLGNRNLRPEILTELEVGTDMEFMGRYALNLTYAKSKADDQILLVPAPASSGFPVQWQNAGQLTSTSWEASLDVPIINRNDLRWSTRLIYDKNRSIITRLDVPPYNTTGGVQGSESMFFVRKGERLGNIYGFAFVTECSQLPGNFASQCGGPGSQFQKNDDGFIVWTGGLGLNEGITANAWNSSLGHGATSASAPWGTRTVWGMPMQLRDSTNTVKQVHLGNATPDFHSAVSSNFTWKKFSAYGLLDGFFGREVWNEGYHWALGDFMSGSVDQGGKSVENAKPIGYYYRAGPSAFGGGSTGVGGLYNVLGPTNESVEDASYVKFREASLTYNVGKLGIAGGDWTVGLVGRNLYTWTKYRGYDPEVGRSGGTQLGSAALVGIDYFTFPNLRTFTLQLSSTF